MNTRHIGVRNIAPNVKIKSTDHGPQRVSYLEPLSKTVRWEPNRFNEVPAGRDAIARHKHRRGNPGGY